MGEAERHSWVVARIFALIVTRAGQDLDHGMIIRHVRAGCAFTVSDEEIETAAHQLADAIEAQGAAA